MQWSLEELGMTMLVLLAGWLVWMYSNSRDMAADSRYAIGGFCIRSCHRKGACR